MKKQFHSTTSLHRFNIANRFTSIFIHIFIYILSLFNKQRPCVAINLWAGQPGMDAWCTRQCAIGNCPEVSCDCNPLTAPPTPAPTTTTTTPTTTTTTPTTTTTTPTT